MSKSLIAILGAVTQRLKRPSFRGSSDSHLDSHLTKRCFLTAELESTRARCEMHLQYYRDLDFGLLVCSFRAHEMMSPSSAG